CAGDGLSLPELSPATQAALREFLPPAASVTNPVDMIATADAPAYARAVALLLDDEDVDALIVIHIPVRREEAALMAAAIRAGRAAARTGAAKPLLTCMLSEAGSGTMEAEAARGGAAGAPEVIPNFRFPESAARALGVACRHTAWLARPEGRVPDLAGLHVEAARAACDAALSARGEGWLRPDEVGEVLAAFGVPSLPTRLCRTPDDAVAAAARLGWPVVVKLASDTLVHKTEWKGVHVDLRDERAVRGAWDAIRATLAAAGRQAEMLGVTVQPFATGGVETMIGLTRDPSFGPLVAFGLGGTAVELFGDVVFRITPLTDVDAEEMLGSIRARKLLTGVRGGPPVDRAALADVLLRVARLAELVPEVAELDLNPVRALPEGQGVAVLDARILVRRP
ncbi:MAG TPA: acetate--CoA ligase family protein, partial [Planctomycetota bacterium]|nr:acetate--CoA ligase family protein [Planctomycetota bacterium]